MHFVSHPTRTFPTYYLEISLGLTAYSLFHLTNGTTNQWHKRMNVYCVSWPLSIHDSKVET